MYSRRKQDIIWQNAPAIHIQVHPLSFLKASEVSRHLRLFHGLVLQVAQALDKLNALVVFATDEGLFSRPQIQFLEGGLSQQTPMGVHTREGGLLAAIDIRVSGYDVCAKSSTPSNMIMLDLSQNGGISSYFTLNRTSVCTGRAKLHDCTTLELHEISAENIFIAQTGTEP